MLMLRLARPAMHTRFEMVLCGGSEAALRAAGEEALEEIARLEDQLSLFRPTSEIARVNRHAAAGPVRVSPPVFKLLQHAAALGAATHGAFDPTVAPLMQAWGLLGGAGALPDAAQLAAARRSVGMDKVELDPATGSVRFAAPGVMLDLGAIGKGFAVDRAIDILREAGVTRAFLHGGTSSCAGIGLTAENQPWKAAVTLSGAPTSQPPLAEWELRDLSLGVSEVRTKCFAADGRLHGHVIDPRSGEPTRSALLAAVALPSAAEADALSTALLVAGEPGLAWLATFRPGARALVLAANPDGSPGRLARLDPPAPASNQPSAARADAPDSAA